MKVAWSCAGLYGRLPGLGPVPWYGWDFQSRGDRGSPELCVAPATWLSPSAPLLFPTAQSLGLGSGQVPRFSSSSREAVPMAVKELPNHSTVLKGPSLESNWLCLIFLSTSQCSHIPQKAKVGRCQSLCLDIDSSPSKTAPLLDKSNPPSWA